MLNSKIKQFAQKPQKTKVPKTHQAKVTRIDPSGVVWVAIDGGAPETPCLTSSVATKPGDRVTVQIQDHRAAVTGNLSSPATDDTLATKAQKNAVNALEKAQGAEVVATRANRYADDAMGKAVEAKKIVDETSEKVDEAIEAADTASKKADEVNQLAQEANEAAASAEEAAGNALTTANEANDIATGAVARSIAAESAINSLNVRTRDGNGESLVRAYAGGVLAGRVGQEYCALVNAGDEDTDPSFDIVRTTWEEGEGTNTIFEFNPDTGEYEETQETVTKAIPVIHDTYASFGRKTVIGQAEEQHVEITDHNFEIKGFGGCAIGGADRRADGFSVTDIVRWSSSGSPNQADLYLVIIPNITVLFSGYYEDAGKVHPIAEQGQYFKVYLETLDTTSSSYVPKYDRTLIFDSTVGDNLSKLNFDSESKSVITIDYANLSNISPDTVRYPDNSGTNRIVAEFITNEPVPSYRFGNPYELNDNFYSSGYCSFSEGNNILATGTCSHAEGWGCAAWGECTHVEGYYCDVHGFCSHVEGCQNTIGPNAYYSHVEGRSNKISGYVYNAHVEGEGNYASHSGAHVEGSHNASSCYDQHVIGRFNRDKSDAVFVIGNGQSNDSRSNAFTVDWNGNTAISGDLSYSSGSEIVSLRAQIASLKAEIQTLRDSISPIRIVADAGFFQGALYKNEQTGAPLNIGITILDSELSNGYVIGADDSGLTLFKRVNGVQTYIGRAVVH